jgi:hypothetical protein
MPAHRKITAETQKKQSEEKDLQEPPGVRGMKHQYDSKRQGGKAMKGSIWCCGTWAWWLGLAAGLVREPRAAWAIQTHGHPEGLYGHQMGHVIFFAAMVYICWQIWRRQLLGRPSFRGLFGASLLFAGWNVLTFFGHIAEEALDPAAIDSRGGYLLRDLQITDLNGLVYYLAKLDHLILVPAFLMLYLGLRAFRAEQLEKGMR